jgi:hypothetical protein
MFVVVFSLGPHFFVKIYVAAVWLEAKGKKKRGDETQFTNKIGGKN